MAVDKDLIFRLRISRSGNRIAWSANDLKRIREQIEKAPGRSLSG